MLACIKVSLTLNNLFNINNINTSRVDNPYIGENNYYEVFITIRLIPILI